MAIMYPQHKMCHTYKVLHNKNREPRASHSHKREGKKMCYSSLHPKLFIILLIIGYSTVHVLQLDIMVKCHWPILPDKQDCLSTCVYAFPFQ